MSDNPYASPAEAAALDTTIVNGFPVASQNKRFANFLIDQVATTFVSMAGGFIVGIMYGISKGGGQITPDEAVSLQFMGMGVGLVLSVLYFFLMEMTTGATVGKLITGTRVVSESGGKASVGQIIGRTLSRMVPFEAFSFLFGDTTTGWHDSWSGTRVIDKRA